MSTPRRKQLSNSIKLFDLAVMILAFVTATLPLLSNANAFSLTRFFSLRVKLSNVLLFILFLAIWNTVLSSFKLYDSRRLSSRSAESLDVFKATSTATAFIALIGRLCHIHMITVTFVLVFWFIVTSTLIVSRLSIRYVLRQLRMKGRNMRNMLIVGTNSRALEFARKVQTRPELGYNITGFVDQDWCGMPRFLSEGYALVSNVQQLPTFLRNNVIDEIVLALPLRSFHMDVSQVAAVCAEQGIIVRMLSSILDLKAVPAKTEEFEENALITHYPGVFDSWALSVKRLLDISLSSILIVLTAPLMLITAVLIKITSPGPALFVQERLGLSKRRFRIYKFRTMVVEAEQKLASIEHLNEVSGPVFKIKEDPRLTVIGKYLRKTSIDELPQLFNVLKGDMSLVGPRPLQVRDYELFTRACPDWQRRRFSVRPGITCLWQINGRSSIPFEQWMELDLQYLRTWSLWLDLQILFRTIPVVLKGLGAA